MHKAYRKEIHYFYRRNPDVMTFVRRRRILLALKIALIELLVFLAAREIHDYGFPIPGILIGAAAALVLPLLLSPWRTFGFGYLGEITEAKENMGYVAEKGVTAKRSDMHYRRLLFLTVRDERGKRHRFRFPALYGKVYRVGGRVLAIPGLDFPIPLTTTTHTVCLFCGGRISIESDHCAGCGKPKLEL